MQVVSSQLIAGKKVLLRLDLDVPIKDGKILDSLRIEAGLPTLDFCLSYAASVVIMGHLGRPNPPAGGEDPNFSVKPIVDWFEEHFAHINLPEGKLHILENLRFEAGEDACDPQFAAELASYGEVFVMEAFAAHHPAASTTVLPTLLPHAAGFRFAKEVEELTKVRKKPLKPMVVIIGGVKIEDKLPAILALSKLADAVLVGGKIAQELKDNSSRELPHNIFLGKLNEMGTDIAQETTQSWENLILEAKMVLWNGPLGAIEDKKNQESRKVAQLIIKSAAKSIVGGGDTIAYLDKLRLLNKFSFVSTGGGAMLEFLVKGTLPTIEALS